MTQLVGEPGGGRSLQRHELCERWTQGDPEAPAGDRLEPLDRLVERAQAFPLVALGYSGDQGDRLEGLLARVRPILSRREFDVPNPPPGGHGPVRVGLLVAGQASGATHEERE